MLIVSLIVMNSLLMGIATFDFVKDNTEMVEIFDALDLFFLITFTIELVFQFGYHGYNCFMMHG